MKKIGGFFELELNDEGEFYPEALKLNTGRNCLEYILRASNYKKIHIPYFICDVVLEPIKKLNIECEFYKIDKDFNPVFDYRKLGEEDAFLYVNYFGLKQKTVIQLSHNIKNLIIDNAQAFFTEPLEGGDTFYSPRKFVGIADGGYLYTNKILNIDLDKDVSYERMSHLLKRIDLGPQDAYLSFKENSRKLTGRGILKMSNLTQKILKSIDYREIKKIREENFIQLHKYLGEQNDLDISLDDLNGPMVYPFMIKDKILRQHLITNKIFVATYWPNVLEWCREGDLEYKMTKYILPLPIDQRYGFKEMGKIIKIIKELLL
jgi:hypothetical protein